MAAFVMQAVYWRSLRDSEQRGGFSNVAVHEYLYDILYHPLIARNIGRQWLAQSRGCGIRRLQGRRLRRWRRIRVDMEDLQVSLRCSSDS